VGILQVEMRYSGSYQIRARTLSDTSVWSLHIHWGTASGIDSGTRGTMYSDAFVSRRFSYIRP
jgi:hypothetical protein